MTTSLNEESSNNSQHHPLQVLGIGTPIVDSLLTVTAEYLHSIEVERGGSTLIDYPTLQKILKNKPISLSSGGSTANTIKGLAQLGHSSSFVGKIGNDEAGKKFSESMESYGVIPHLSFSPLPTAQTACLITPDHERTMLTFIGAGAEMNEADLTPELFKDVSLVHIEGYLMNRPDFVQKAAQLAKQNGVKISFDLSSFEIVEEYKKSLTDLLSNFIDIVFANEEEAYAMTGLPPEKACVLLKDLCSVAVVKMGSKGCWAATETKKAFHHIFPVKVVDTTGAGDLFASGFLHGFLSNQSLEECLRNGSFIASKVIEVLGAEIPKAEWPEIMKNLAMFPNPLD